MNSLSPDEKIMSLADAAVWRDSLRDAGRKLVVTNGCFDLLHRGHAEYLRQARSCGDALAVLINSDASVRALKGPSRPVNSESDRAFLLASLACVDAVIVFPGRRCTAELDALRPDVYVKGGDYTPETLDPEEHAALSAAGSALKFISFVPGHSTTSTLSRFHEAEKRERSILFDETDIRNRVAELGREISSFYAGNSFTLVALLNGGMIFAADLVRRLDSPLCRLDSFAVSSYLNDASTGEITVRSHLKFDPAGQHILLVDDILDTGVTLARTVDYFRSHGAASVRVCVLLNKQLSPDLKKWDAADWVGFSIPDRYVIGYGLDSREQYRNLPYIGVKQDPSN